MALIARRCLWMPPTLFGLLLIVFTVSHVIPSDPARVMAGENASADQVAAIRHQYGLDLPLPLQFLHYVEGVVTGDMGISLFTQRPVAEDLVAGCRRRWNLAVYAMVLAIVAGVPLGVVAALRRNSWLDHFVRSSPSRVSRWRRSGWRSCCNCCSRCGSADTGTGPDRWLGSRSDHRVLHRGRGAARRLGDAGSGTAPPDMPTLTLALPAVATIVRFTRAGMINVMSSNFVFYQTAMGIPRRRIVWKYLLRAALIGTLTQIGLIFGNLIAGAVVVETVFDWPGLGSFAVNSILHSDYNAVMSFTVFAGVVFILTNLAVDIAQTLLDPRGR
jgi:peptide/nickel transport system permease protein